jgi:hypothetical protein
VFGVHSNLQQQQVHDDDDDVDEDDGGDDIDDHDDNDGSDNCDDIGDNDNDNGEKEEEGLLEVVVSMVMMVIPSMTMLIDKNSIVGMT